MKSQKRKLLQLIFFFLLLSLISSYAQTNDSNNKGSINDTTLSRAVMQKIASSAFYGIFDWVTATANNGVVTLNGWVHLPWLTSQLQKIAEKEPGVKSVVNHIQKTFGPGETGVRAAQAIYNDPYFYGMGFEKNPPIHIIVNNDVILLEGIVDSEQEKDHAAFLCNNFTNAFKVQNNLLVVKAQ
jgi:osmotically-inducible protein OsmY